jgi:hypothetical protein
MAVEPLLTLLQPLNRAGLWRFGEKTPIGVSKDDLPLAVSLSTVKDLARGDIVMQSGLPKKEL